MATGVRKLCFQHLFVRGNYCEWERFEDSSPALNLTKPGSALNYITSQSDKYDYVYTFATTKSRRTQIVIDNKIPPTF